MPTFAAWSYTENVRSAVHRFKFGNQPELARRAARSLLLRLPKTLCAPQVWVPVPLSPSRLLERGYNQAALLARELARLTGSPSPQHLLVRTDVTGQQSALDRVARFENAAASFDVAKGPRGAGLNHPVVLVDDVLTTGATARACCERLRSSGIEPLAVVTLAQVV